MIRISGLHLPSRFDSTAFSFNSASNLARSESNLLICLSTYSSTLERVNKLKLIMCHKVS